MQNNTLITIHFINVYLLYMFTRLYFFTRSHGKPVEARSFLPIVVGGALALLWVFFKFSFWFIIISFIVTSLYALEGYYKMKRGLIKVDKVNIKYATLLIELLIMFILSLIVVKLLGLNYFTEGF